MTFEEFWHRYYRDVVNDLIRAGTRPQDAEELAADALHATWPRIQQIRPEALWTYLRVASRRGAINLRRNENAQRRDAAATRPLDELRNDSHSRTPEREVIEREALARVHAGVRAVMARLPAETKVYIAARHRGLSYQQIANEFGVRIPAVQSRLHRATKQFEELLGAAPEGLTWIEIAGELNDDHQR